VLCVELDPEEQRVRLVIEWERGREGCCAECRTQSRHFWNCRSVSRARKFFGDWWRKAKRSKLEPVKEVADKLKRHMEGLLNYITHPITNGVAEAMNSVIQSLKNAARGFRSFNHYRVAILFHCGKLNLLPTLNQPLHTIP
jgi:transposase